MPVTVQHKDFLKYSQAWRKCRDVVEGSDAIKAADKDTRQYYLPKTSGQTKTEYEGYKNRAVFYNATSRTVEGLSGLIFRKEPIVESPASMEEYLEDVDLQGTSLSDFLEKIVDEAIQVGRGGILVEHPSTPADVEITVAEAEAMGIRPYLAYYRAEDIRYWETSRVNNRTMVSMVILHELVAERVPEDEFKTTDVEQYRVLDLTTGAYRQRVFRKTESDWVAITETYPMMGGAPMREIPFVFIGTRDSSPEVQKPILLDLVDVNISHYQTSADLENGAHWAGTPTPIFLGRFVDSSENGEPVTEIRLGSTSGIQIEEGGDAKFLEFTGAGLEALEKRAQRKEELMATLGARIISQEKRQVEAAETASIHRAGENSVLASMANAISRGVSKALAIMARWAGLGEVEVKVELNTDYLPVKMDPQMLTALTAAVQAGKISFSSYFYNLQKGEIVQPEKTWEDEKDEIDSEGPSLGLMEISGGADAEGTE